ncbi:glutathione-dependent formaldehyde-activating enzyme [Plectosphaerella plurivora]|uniref:Glutathione-dependent formaldehyde-activating enzyme n=1 Tax=Plectosphaerella plurivora TaxID=936078 RepID=A0A9P8V9V4_9PEZI|nr:glutathione-dependent formaldehyde-activating enzyme [Plectosphaerella plurivora]
MSDQDQPLKTYRANCHCGAFIYEVDLPELKTVRNCNCSICSRKGYIFTGPSHPEALKIVKGDEAGLTTYSFGAGKMEHKFCPDCATPLLVRMDIDDPKYALGLNVHAFQDVDTWALERKTFDGKNYGSPYETPKYTGPQPAEEVEGGRTYTGSCHCGRVQVALSTKPLDETFPDPVAECKCSICERNGYLWVWPMGVNVALHGDDKDIGRYVFARKMMAKTFCKTCGVNLTNQPVDLAEDVIAAMGEEDRGWFLSGRQRHPVNIRVLHDVDLTKLTPSRMTQSRDMGPKYVNP